MPGGESVKDKPRKAKKSDLRELTKQELYTRAQEQDIPGRSSMTRDELIRALS